MKRRVTYSILSATVLIVAALGLLSTYRGALHAPGTDGSAELHPPSTNEGVPVEGDLPAVSATQSLQAGTPASRLPPSQSSGSSCPSDKATSSSSASPPTLCAKGLPERLPVPRHRKSRPVNKSEPGSEGKQTRRSAMRPENTVEIPRRLRYSVAFLYL
jgi:hypothetical protein